MMRRQPVTNPFYEARYIVTVGQDVLPSNVGYEFLISILLGIEHHTDLRFLLFIAVPLASKEKAEFERHIESQKTAEKIKFDTRDVMKSESTSFDDLVNFFDPHLTSRHLKCATRNEATCEHREYDRPKHRLIKIVERTIDKDVVFKWNGRQMISLDLSAQRSLRAIA